MAKGLLAIGVKKDTHVGIWARNVPRQADISVCLRQNRCRGRYGQHELQAGGTGSTSAKLRHAYSVYRRRRKGQQLRGNDYTMLPELKLFERGHMKSKRFPHMRNVVYIGQEKYRGMYNTAGDSAVRKQH